MINYISSLFMQTDTPRILFKEMDQMKPFEEVVLDSDGNGGIVGWKIPLSSASTILFQNEGKKGARYIKHLHDCKETCRIKSGKIQFFSKMGTRILVPGDVIVYHPGIVHHAVWLEDGEMFVEFNKVY